MLERWRQQAKGLKREIYALYFACRDPRVPWYAKVLAFGVVAYALSPIDLIPDFIPVLGYLDDLILIPLGVIAVRAMIPPEVMAECKTKAAQSETKPNSWIGAVVIVAIWLTIAGAAVYWLIGNVNVPLEASWWKRLSAPAGSGR